VSEPGKDETRENKGYLRIQTGGKWSTIELGDFLNDLSIFYNIYKIGKSADLLYGVSRILEGGQTIGQRTRDFFQYYNVGTKESLNISKITIGSPGEIVIEGDVDGVDQLAKLYEIAMSLPPGPIYSCINKLLETNEDTKFIHNYGYLGEEIAYLICKELESFRSLYNQQKVVTIGVTHS